VSDNALYSHGTAVKPYTLQTWFVPGEWLKIACILVLKDGDYDNNNNNNINDIWVQHLDLSTQSLQEVTVH